MHSAIAASKSVTVALIIVVVFVNDKSGVRSTQSSLRGGFCLLERALDRLEIMPDAIVPNRQLCSCLLHCCLLGRTLRCTCCCYSLPLSLRSFVVLDGALVDLRDLGVQEGELTAVLDCSLPADTAITNGKGCSTASRTFCTQGSQLYRRQRLTIRASRRRLRLELARQVLDEHLERRHCLLTPHMEMRVHIRHTTPVCCNTANQQVAGGTDEPTHRSRAVPARRPDPCPVGS